MKFALGGLLGGLASLTVSVGLMPMIATGALALLFGFASRSYAAISGVLCGFGVTWVVLIGNSYRRCASMGADCGGSRGMVPFLVIAGIVFLMGMAVGVLAIFRNRAKRHDVRGSSI